ADGVSFDERRVAPFAPAQWDWRERSSKAILDALGAKIVLIRGRAEQTHRSCLHSAPLTAPAAGQVFGVLPQCKAGVP
ncbi:hypothetical protein DVU14_13635, partial [Staphylococcus argenteus]|nr:hypothetical protein [Staphylococcus argenteus]